MHRIYRDDYLSPAVTMLGFSELLLLIAHGCGIQNMHYPLRFLLSVSIFMFFLMTGYELKQRKQIRDFLMDLRRDTIYILLPFTAVMVFIRSDLVFHDLHIYLLWILLAFYVVRAIYSVISSVLLLLHCRNKLIIGLIMLISGIIGAFIGFLGGHIPFQTDAILTSFFPAACGFFLRCFHDRYFIQTNRKVLHFSILAVIFVISILTGLFADPVHHQYPFIVLGIILSVGSALFLLWLSQFIIRLPIVRDICNTLANHPVLVLCIVRLDLYIMQIWTSQYDIVRILLRTLTDLSMVLIISLFRNAIHSTKITRTDHVLCQKYLKIFNIYFYIAFTLLIIRSTLSQTMIGSSIDGTILNTWFYQPTKWIAYSLILVFAIALSSVQNKVQIFFEFGIFAAVIIWYHNNSVYYIYVLILLMLAATGKNFKIILKIYFSVVLSLLIIAWWTSLHGYVTNLVYYRDKINRTGPRYALGANYVTDLAAHWFYLITLICIAVPKKKNWKSFIIYPVLFYVAYYIYHVTNSRLDMIATFALILITLLAHIRHYMHTGKIYEHAASAISYICSFSYLLCTALSFYMVANYNLKTMDMPFQSFFGKFMDLTNLKSRLRISKTALSEYSLNIFGNASVYTEIGEGGRFSTPPKITFLDISYIKIPFMYGLLIAAVLLSIWTFIILHQAQQHHTFWVLILTVVACTGLIEHHLAEYYYNIFTVAAFTSTLLTGRNTNESYIHEQ